MNEPSDVRSVPYDRVLAAIAHLGFQPAYDVFEVKISLHEITISYHDRYNGRLNGGRMTHTVPIDRRPTDG